MLTNKLPLAERLGRIKAGRTAHDEYVPSLIDAVKTAKITAYLDGYDAELRHVQARMGLSDDSLRRWTYRDMAAHIADRYCSGSPSAKAEAADLLDLLIAPMLAVHKIVQERRRKEGNQ